MATHAHHGALSALDAAPVWLNSEPLTAAGLHGKAVLVDVWTYSCVNWLRTLPYVRAWHSRYAGDGLVVVGVHAPEFGFEHHLDNVRRAVASLEVPFPVVIDNDFAIWRAFDNHYWPAVYLLDGDGQVRFTHFGEEAYAETERAIQALLGVEGELVAVDTDGVTLAADWASLRSPETYLGALRGERRSGGGELSLNTWSLDGAWSAGEEAAVLEGDAGTLTYRFDARDVNLVAGPGADGPVPFTVTLDGSPPGPDAGVDVDADGAGVMDEPRMYQLVRQAGGARERTFAIAFAAPGARVYSFTFG